jgi:tRNA(Ile)-lysidine synthase
VDVTNIGARLRDHAARHTPALFGRAVILAVSGGADSIATAALLCETSIIHTERSTVAHFDHGLRGRVAADRDLAAVEALCASYGLPLIVERWRSPRPGEAAARSARYAFLAEAALRASLTTVVTGHTSDDQVETIVMHLLRGSGVVGLQGMPAERHLAPGVTLVRPALALAREDSRAYCSARGLTYADDCTNDDMTLLRNRVRRRILPGLERRLPGVRGSLLDLSSRARTAVHAAEAAARPAIVGRDTSTASLDRQFLRTLPVEVRAHAFRLAYGHVAGDAAELGRHHYGALQRAVDGRTGALLQLPRGVNVHIDHDALLVSRETASVGAIPPDFEAGIPFSGNVGAWSVAILRCSDARDGAQLPIAAVLRRRRAGDRMHLRGGTRKLQDVLVDARIPRRERDALPVIAVGADVLWTPCAVARNAPGLHPRFAITAKHI